RRHTSNFFEKCGNATFLDPCAVQKKSRIGAGAASSRRILFSTSEAVCCSRMSPELNTDLELVIGHVLFIDIVGYSKLLINEQHESLHELNQIVRNTGAFRAAEAA